MINNNIIVFNNILISCPECSNGVITDSCRGETICKSCGLVVSEREIDISREGKHIYTREEANNKSQVELVDSRTLPGKAFQTYIRKKDVSDPDFKRIMKWDTRLIDSKDKNHVIALSELRRICGILKIPFTVRVSMIILYKKAVEKKLTRGRSINGIVCACIYYICRVREIPITFKELCEVSGIGLRKVKRSYFALCKIFNLKVPVVRLGVLISKYCSLLGIGYIIENKVREIFKYIKDKYFIGKNPRGICAGVIYFICKREGILRTQKGIAKVCGVSEVTVRNVYKEINKLFK